MINVLLINPPQTQYKDSVGFDLHLPIGLMYVAAMVRDICHVQIFDCLLTDLRVENGSATTYGASQEIIQKIIFEKKPDVVGISVHATPNYQNAQMVARIAKDVNPKIVTVFGGPDPSVRFESILKDKNADYCVVGDGEETFYELISKISISSPVEGVKGLAFKQGGTIHFEPRLFNSNLDELPFPAFDLVDLKKYQKSKSYYRIRSEIFESSATIITSRGCPNRCIFCSVRLHMGQKFRAHSPEYVLRLLRFCKDKYGISNFHFEDDNISCNPERFEKILDRIIEENLNIKWDTPNGLRVDSLNYNILKKMKQSGCIHIALAIESGNQRVLNEVINKRLNLETAVEIVKYCKELKIPAHAFYVIGFPGEKIAEMEDTTNLAIDLYRKYDLSAVLMVATPLYGTDLYEICVRDKLIEGQPTCEQLSIAIQSSGEPMISTSDFSREDVKQVIRRYEKRLQIVHTLHSLRYPRKSILRRWHRIIGLTKKITLSELRMTNSISRNN